ncbi:hypothetical protein AXF42_Ash003073 [Apostasia shenzhenica]|uniref:Uncharacterized protein n=1 Tax=Apostasia shenzhenica TaxID=1088818 RepID=A0A2I0A839_9ASPA|nr:hypothetical protein AXF42_Ash003073 [Apostasia shenzhenica]
MASVLHLGRQIDQRRLSGSPQKAESGTAVRIRPGFHHRQQLQDDDLARSHSRRQLQRRRLPPPARPIGRFHRPGRVVRPHLGPDRLRLRRRRQRLLPDRRLRHHAEMLRLRPDAGDPRRVHARLLGLLRRQPRRRVQLAGAGPAGRWPGEVRDRWLQQRPPGGLPAGAGDEGRRKDGGLPERVRRVQFGRILLPGVVREFGDLPADVLLEEVQERLPDGVQLRLRRSFQHLHLLQRRLRHHLLRRKRVKAFIYLL